MVYSVANKHSGVCFDNRAANRFYAESVNGRFILETQCPCGAKLGKQDLSVFGYVYRSSSGLKRTQWG